MFEVVKSSNIDVRRNHQDAWSNFYSDVWRREFGTKFGVMPSFLLDALGKHLKSYNAKISQLASGQYVIIFDQERDFTWFELKWTAHCDPDYT